MISAPYLRPSLPSLPPFHQLQVRHHQQMELQVPILLQVHLNSTAPLSHSFLLVL